MSKAGGTVEAAGALAEVGEFSAGALELCKDEARVRMSRKGCARLDLNRG